MKINARHIGAFAIAASVLLGACSSSGGSAAPTAAGSAAASSGASTGTGSGGCVNGSITVVGSTALQPLVDAAAKKYVAGCSGATINVQGGGSGTGLTQVLGGGAQIGDSDIFAQEKLQPADASQLVDHQVVKQGWVMVLSKDVTGVTNLTKQQAKDIWTGVTTNWKAVGGPDEPIVLIIRPASSGTRATFKKLVLGGANESSGQALTEDSNGAVTTAVTGTPGSTSVIGFAFYQQNKDKLIGLQLDGVDPSVDNMVSGKYALSAYGHMYTKGEATGLAKAFIDYMYTSDVQTGVEPGLFFAPVAPGNPGQP